MSFRWFNNSFFSYVRNPPCTNCSSPTSWIKTTPATAEEEIQGIVRVELHQCSVASCSEYVHFPRITDPIALLRTRKGRQGEWVNCFTLLCRALGARVRYVWCSEDLAWTEFYSEHQRRWVHIDSCEKSWDMPRMYTEGMKSNRLKGYV